MSHSVSNCHKRIKSEAKRCHLLNRLRLKCVNVLYFLVCRQEWGCIFYPKIPFHITEALQRVGGGGEVHVARLNFKTSCVRVYKCLSLIVGFAVTVGIWPREVVSCRDFILRAVATFWALSLVRIYPGRAS